MEKETKILVGILILAILLRGVNLPRKFEGDEIVHVTAAKSLVRGGPLRTLAFSKEITEKGWQERSILEENPYRVWGAHPAFDVLLFTLFASLPLTEEISFRLLPFICGILAIIFTYLIGKEIFNEKVGLMAAFLGSISPYHLFHSSFILESDAIIAFLVPLSFFFYVKWRENRKEKSLFYLTGISLGLIVLTKFTGLLFLGFILFYELIQKRFKEALGVLIILGLLFGIWIAYDYFIMTDFGWVEAFLSHGLPNLGGGGMTLSHRLYKMVYSTGILIEELTPPLCALSLLVFFSLIGKLTKNFNLSKLKELFLRYEVMLLLWILLNLIYFLEGSGDPQRYFGIAAPFLFILVARFVTEFKWKRSYLIIATLLFLLICYFFQINDYQFYTYMVYKNNLLTLLAWSLPFLLIFPYFIKNFRNEIISILIGAYLGFSFYFILFSSQAWPIAISETTAYISQDTESSFVVSKSHYVLESSMYYDWVEDGKLEKRYFRISLDEVKKFDEENKENCKKKTFGGYPLVFLCRELFP